ncbi:sugar phosphate isomerase/epimerase family protein [Promicromonospora xylanilytica]
MENTSKLSRRSLLTAGAAAAGVLASMSPASAETVATGAARGRGNGFGIPEESVGMQIFTMRSLVSSTLGLEGALEIAADAGVKQAELAGSFYDRSPAELRQIFRSFDIDIASNHFGPRGGSEVLPWATPEGRSAIYRDAEALGFPLVGTGSLGGIIARDNHTRDEYLRAADLFNQWGRDAKHNGMAGFFFHNHDSEFALDGQGKPLFDLFIENTDPEYVFFELDLGWVAVSGQDPKKYIQAYQSRIPYFHVKDVTWDPAGNRTAAAGTVNAGRNFRFTDVGKGDIDWADVLSPIRNWGKHRFFLEHDDAGDLALNPAGSANTIWRGCSHLHELPRRRR